MISRKAIAITCTVLFALMISGCDSNNNNRPSGVFTPDDVEAGEPRVQDGAQMGGMSGGMGGGGPKAGGPSGKAGAKSGKSKGSKDGKGERGKGRGGFGGFGGGGFNLDPESIFKDRDKNEDGKITEDEIDPDAPAWMNPMRFDTDKDGAVSKEEFQKGIEEAMKRFREGGFGGGGFGGAGGFGQGKNRRQSKDRPDSDEDDSKSDEKSKADSSKEG